MGFGKRQICLGLGEKSGKLDQKPAVLPPPLLPSRSLARAQQHSYRLNWRKTGLKPELRPAAGEMAHSAEPWHGILYTLVTTVTEISAL